LKLSAIILARTLGYIETFDLSPRGKVFFPAVVEGIVERYNFQKFPTKPEDFDESKGVVFEEGKIGDRIIQKFTIFTHILVVETRSNTSDSKQILEEMLVWGASHFGLAYVPGSIKRFAYVSDVTFYSDVPLLGAACQPLADLASKTSAALAEIWQEPVEYYPANLAVGHDPMARRYGIAPFTITHRSEARYFENKYFSEAPLPTDTHLSLLKEFEAGIKRLLEQQGNK
jgi:hypothetical protein